MSFSVRNHSINKKSIWFFNQWLFWHESNTKLAKMIILLIENENNNQALHSELLRLS